MRVRGTTVLAAVAVVAAGCRGNPVGTVFPSFGQPQWDEQLHRSLQKKYADLDGYTKANYYDVADPDVRRRHRDQICRELMWLVDYAYAQDVHDLQLGGDSLNFFGDLATLGLTTAATISGGNEAKTALAGLATLVVGTKTALDADFLHRQAVTALITEMDAVRKHRAAVIEVKLALPDGEYPLYRALDDVYQYKLGGSPLGAIVELENLTTGNNAKADDEIRDAKEWVIKVYAGKVVGGEPTLAGQTLSPATPQQPGHR